eukprot:CAMPEP_0183331834 /NCGR_PEP_ID=MMETSP0164_2-20130417/1154_1 /TAXON_ID=221442 /ORGANISM="Coccolithus pelagicus ssp braarudi, Strain PLY182g" /LENGTH=171 /DNA_ID=CAMNT_0025500421 /DNA_START=77 /DNA_END=592 /DNA_ORIENTATION=+
MVGKRNASSSPRAVGGGRSARYEERRARRGGGFQYAPEWSDAAAAAVFDKFHVGERFQVARVVGLLMGVAGELRAWVEELRVSEHDREVTLSILEVHAARMKGAKGGAARKVLGRRLLKPLWDRRAARVPVEGLEVPAAQMCPAWLLRTYSQWERGAAQDATDGTVSASLV